MRSTRTRQAIGPPSVRQGANHGAYNNSYPARQTGVPGAPRYVDVNYAQED